MRNSGRLRDRIRYETLGGCLTRATPLLLTAVIAFVLNLVWEILHSPLYAGMPPLRQHLPFLVMASVGDVVISMIPVVVVGFWYRRVWWFNELSRNQSLIFLLLSTVLSGANEALNVLVLGRWHYTARMPTVPLIPIGISPLLQLSVTPFVSLLAANRILRRFRSKG